MEDPSVAVVAWSTDGTSFNYRGPVGGDVHLGSYVVLGAPQGDLLGQVLSQRSVEAAGRRLLTGTGQLLRVQTGQLAFDEVAVSPAPDRLIAERLGRRGATLEMGALRGAPEVTARLEAKGFNRHTFLCGQSGSGKTYSLGRLLEELVLRTRLPLLVLDPNGDHVHLGRTGPDVDPVVAAAYAEAARGVRVLRAAPDEGFASVDAATEAFRASGDEVLELIRMRVENLGVDRMAAWAKRSARAVGEVWSQDRPRALIADTSGFEERRERIAVTVAVLEHLWADRTQRRPLLLVVDEAHDVCPSDPVDQLQRLAVDRFTRIAGEGRKYGIHLLLASQRPDKLPENVLTQCDTGADRARRDLRPRGEPARGQGVTRPAAGADRQAPDPGGWCRHPHGLGHVSVRPCHVSYSRPRLRAASTAARYPPTFHLDGCGRSGRRQPHVIAPALPEPLVSRRRPTP